MAVGNANPPRAFLASCCVAFMALRFWPGLACIAYAELKMASTYLTFFCRFYFK